jgi:ABC-type amino acid transport system permease subunit
MEAALCSGHTYSQAFRYILVPQAVRVIIPPLTTQYTQVIKNSSVVMLIAIEELTFQTQMIEQQTFRGFEASTAATILYILLVFVVVGCMSLVQRRLALS